MCVCVIPDSRCVSVFRFNVKVVFVGFSKTTTTHPPTCFQLKTSNQICRRLLCTFFSLVISRKRKHFRRKLTRRRLCLRFCLIRVVKCRSHQNTHTFSYCWWQSILKRKHSIIDLGLSIRQQYVSLFKTQSWNAQCKKNRKNLNETKIGKRKLVRQFDHKCGTRA